MLDLPRKGISRGYLLDDRDVRQSRLKERMQESIQSAMHDHNEFSKKQKKASQLKKNTKRLAKIQTGQKVGSLYLQHLCEGNDQY